MSLIFSSTKKQKIVKTISLYSYYNHKPSKKYSSRDTIPFQQNPSRNAGTETIKISLLFCKLLWHAMANLYIICCTHMAVQWWNADKRTFIKGFVSDCRHLKGTVSQDCRLLVFLWISFPQDPEYTIRAFFSKIHSSRCTTSVKWKKSSIIKVLIILFGHLWEVELTIL